MSKFHWLSLLALLPFCLISDWLIYHHYYFSQAYWGIYDNWVHGVIAVLIALPVFSKLNWRNMLLVFLIASLLDLDHFAVNWSFSLSKAISLTMRPPTHSISFALAVSLLFGLSTKNVKWTWIVFSAIASHVVRDAYGGGTPICYPLAISQIPHWFYSVVEVLLWGVSWSLFLKRRYPQ